MIYSHLKNGRKSQASKLIIVHAMGEYIADGKGGYDHAVPFLGKYGLSVHSLIAPNGDNYRCRDDWEGAWHARGHNTDSLGIEFLVQGDHDYGSFIKSIDSEYVTEEQYQSGLSQIVSWMNKFDITKVVRHSDISPGRKVDPGRGFPWSRLLTDIGLNNEQI